MGKNSGFRSGFVALVGHPNVGKSTLLNALCGEKVAIVTPKPQTTRTRIHGILNLPRAQVVFVDTPGLGPRTSQLHRAMRRVAGQAAADSDVTLLVVEANREHPQVSPESQELVRAARSAPTSDEELVLAINKIDRIRPKSRLLPWIEAYSTDLDVPTVMPISAKTGDGLERLLDTLVGLLPAGPPLFPTDLHTDQAERFICEELVREQILLKTHQEVPHSAAVRLERFEDQRSDEEEGGRCWLEGRIYLEANSQKGIVIGNKGVKIKEISRAARREIEELLGCPVFLRLTVAVDKRWTRTERGVRRFGLEGPK